MKPHKFSRRRFLGGMLLLPVLASCRKGAGVNPYAKPGSMGPNRPVPDPSVVTDDFLAQYGKTEMGPRLVAADPSFNKTINGYTDRVSYKPGDTVDVYLSGPANSSMTISLLDSGRKQVASVNTAITTQTIKSSKPWVDGFQYDKTFSFRIPADFKSGLYTWMGQIPFVCKAPNEAADLAIVYPSNTMSAYNFAGGKSIYAPDDDNRATVLSFLRSRVVDYVEFYKWIDKQSYTVNHVADSDLDDYNSIDNARVLIIVGHSEYWTRKARTNVDKFIASGKNVLVLSGNNMWWQVRYNQSKNTMICYKDSSADPLGNSIYDTTSWSYPMLQYPVIPSLGADFTDGGYGNTLTSRWGGYKIVKAESPIFKGANVKNGDILDLDTREYDSVPVMKMLAPGSTDMPAIDYSKIDFEKIEILGYDFAQNTNRADKNGLGTFIVCRKNASAGTIVNIASMDWAYYLVYEKYRVMTKNMIDLSLANGSLFS